MRYFLAILALGALLAAPAAAAEPPAMREQPPSVEFPNRVTFQGTASAAAGIREVSLEYGVDQLTCGAQVARAFPQVEAGATTAEVAWTWDMRQSGSLPPGARIWYRWHVTDAAGATFSGERRELTWLESAQPWRTLERGALALHWYEGGQDYAEDLLATADAAMARLTREIGVAPLRTVHLYIYPDLASMRDAVLYEPHWTGGQAYPADSIVIIGIEPDNLAWGRLTVAHELSHVLVGHRAFSCLGSVPSWLDEGLAMYSEGEPDQDQRAALAAAADEDRLLPLRGLGGGFPEDAAQANLAYAQSHSLVRFLLAAGGRERMLGLLDALARGDALDDALGAAYGFGLDALEDRWRASLGAPELRDARREPTSTPEPTVVPTFAPAQAPAAATAAPPDPARPSPQPAAAPLAQPSPPPAEPAEPAPSPLLLAGAALAAAIVVAGLVIGTRKRS